MSEAVVEDPSGPNADGMVNVVMPSGATFPVHTEEVDYIKDRSARYLADNHISNVSDLQDFDRMLIMEMMCFRWGTWISQEKDYWDEPVDTNKLQESLKTHGTELRQLKKQLGIDKVSRDKAKGEDSTPAFIASLLQRAKEFGITREAMLDKGLELFSELQALVQLHLNCDEIERRELRCRQEDILDWLINVAFPQYEAIDDYFRTHSQKTWIRKV